MAASLPNGFWMASGEGKDTIAIAVGKPGDPGKTRYLTHVHASYVVPGAQGTLTVKVDGQVVAQMAVQGGVSIEFVPPLWLGQGKDVSAELTVDNAPMVEGSVVIAGYEE